MLCAEREHTACFSGHRIIPAETHSQLSALLVTAVDSLVAAGVTSFICGGAIGFDTMAAQTVLAAREQNPDVRLILALPCKDQSNRWPAKDVAQYVEHIALADEVHWISETYTSDCMHRRNRFMVDHAAIVVTYCTRPRGGTAQTIAYAERQGIRHISLHKPSA